MTQISLFETPLWMYQLDLNTDEIESDARQYCSTIPSSVRSNEGGFQGNRSHRSVKQRKPGT